MTELAKDPGVNLEFVPTDWKTLVSGVTSGKYHMTGSASVSSARDFQEVLAGRADAHITSNVEANKLVIKYPQMMIVPVSAPKSPTPIAILLPQADQVWINYVNTWIRLKQERGFFAALGAKWNLNN